MNPLGFADSADHQFFALLEKARHGDAAALGELIEHYRPYLLKIAFDEGDTNLQGKAGDSDIVQNTYIQALNIFGQFQGKTADEMRAWLRQILLLQVNDFRKSYHRDKRDIAAEVPLQTLNTQDSQNDKLLDNADSPSEQIMFQEECAWLERALNALPETDRTIITLRQRDGRPFRDIAGAVGLSEAATQKRWARAIQTLQEQVKRQHG